MKWGIIGYGTIAPSFLESLRQCNGQNLQAIASKSKYNELLSDPSFAGIEIYSNYEDLYTDTSIKIVYIATTNNLHKENVINCLKSGKHVLSEKPLGICKSDAIEMINCAKANKRFLMEGMWTRFLPAYKEFIRLIHSGAVGDLKFVQVDFGFLSIWGEERRLLNRELYGGAILDNTDYNIFVCKDIFKESPIKIEATAHFAHTGIENSCSVVLSYQSGAIAQLYSGFIQKTNQDAVVYGSKGSIKLKEFWHGTEIELVLDGKKKQVIQLPYKSTGFVHEIEEVVKCIEQDKIESDIIPHLLSIEVADIIDKVLKQIRR